MSYTTHHSLVWLILLVSISIVLELETFVTVGHNAVEWPYLPVIFRNMVKKRTSDVVGEKFLRASINTAVDLVESLAIGLSLDQI